jgi:Na+/phosphate symporter
MSDLLFDINAELENITDFSESITCELTQYSKQHDVSNKLDDLFTEINDCAIWINRASNEIKKLIE